MITITLPSNIGESLIELITFIVGIIGFWFYLKDRQLKRVSYEFHSRWRLLAKAKPEIQEKAKTLTNGKAEKYVYRVVTRIANTGTTPIEVDDFIRPISIEFGSVNKIAGVEVLDTQPADLEVSITPDEQRVKIDPLLLNQGDWIECALWVTGNKPTPKVHARISGVPKL